MTVTLPIYLDHHATTPCDPRVVEAMLPYLGELYGNPASRTHSFGWAAREATEIAREQVAHMLGADPREIVFTSGATESDNLALKGVVEARGGGHVVTTCIEHKAVLDACAWLERQGVEVTYLDVNQQGRVEPGQVRDALRDETVLCSVMWANNEIGVIQPVREIAEVCHERGVLVHCDAAQGVGMLPCEVGHLGVDLLSVSAHKMYGPKGIGALYVRRGRPRIGLCEQVHGGGHERGMRSGTLPVHQLVGMGRAAELVVSFLENGGPTRVEALRDRLLEGIHGSLDGVHLNGTREHRLPHNLNLSFEGVDGEALLMGLRDLALSSGSACSSATLEPSYVLRALGVDPELAHSSVRFGLGRSTTAEEIEHATDLVVEKVKELRAMGPLLEVGSLGGEA
ncbi:MAG: IscS subfamily cysteine desulfurase [Myxococcota bacterium]|jgi:cysteine desulfurase|nr:IscS subfamily cysteine desulfurase [Myxococcota bacterium]